MTVTYEQARDIVLREVAPGWNVGTFCLDDRQITENGTTFAFAVGAREFIVDGDPAFLILGGIPVVRKDDGTLAWWPSVMVAMDSTMVSRANPAPTLVL